MDRDLPPVGEDCLNLNVWTPAPGATRLPVMVFAHGGGQVSGAASLPLYDGSRLAAEGVVVVANNRRLGAEGFLYLGDCVDDERGLGNFGIQDQIAALAWVQENIAAFGGDPANVTLFGESGGGATVGAVMASPAADGLYRRAIAMSGGHAAHSRPGAAAVARQLFDALGIDQGDVERLADRPWQDLVATYPGLDAIERDAPQVFLPVINEHMPVHPADATFAGHADEVDLLIGSCRDEASLFSLLSGGAVPAAFERRAARMAELAGVDMQALAAAYGRAHPDWDTERVRSAIAGDLWFRVPSLRIADGHAIHAAGSTFMYLFTWESPNAGAAHALDLMLFGNGLPFAPVVGDAPHAEAAANLRAAWVLFARSGRPAAEPAWPVYAPGAPWTMQIDSGLSLSADPYAEQRRVLEPLLTANWTETGI